MSICVNTLAMVKNVHLEKVHLSQLIFYLSSQPVYLTGLVMCFIRFLAIIKNTVLYLNCSHIKFATN